ncbi:7485_t:CDS:2, partial [Gigaspora margarita]
MSNEPREPVSDIDPCIKAYIDNANQTIITMLLGRIEEIMNCQTETQRHWNEQVQKTMDEHFRGPGNDMLTTNNTGRIPQGNYPTTPMLNNIIINLVLSKALAGTKGELSVIQ